MRRELIALCSSFFILCLLALPACESTSTAPKPGDHEPLNLEKQLKEKYESRKDHQRTHRKMHVVHHFKVTQKAKGTYGGASDLKRPRPGKSAASSLLVKSPTLLFSTVVSHVAAGLLILALFY